MEPWGTVTVLGANACPEPQRPNNAARVTKRWWRCAQAPARVVKITCAARDEACAADVAVFWRTACLGVGTASPERHQQCGNGVEVVCARKRWLRVWGMGLTTGEPIQAGTVP